MQSTDFLKRLVHRLPQPLPGIESHLKMIPAERLADFLNLKTAFKPMQSSVLIALYPLGDGLGTLLIKRTPDNTPHSGQISFPGGRQDPGDLTPVHTALREAREEIGLDADRIQVLGSLSPLYVAPSNFTIHPVVGYIAQPGGLTPSPEEAEYIIELPLHNLEDYMAHVDIEVRGYTLKQVPCFSHSGHIIWGATAMILQELLDVMECVGIS